MSVLPAEAPWIPSIPPLAPGGLIHVIIDTPRGSRSKYKFDKVSGLFTLSRILPPGLQFPCDFGFIPGTIGEDGDALDVALISEESSIVGCLITVRLLGLLRAHQIDQGKNVRNDRFVAVPATAVNVPKQRDLRDVAGMQLDALENFFVVYNQLQGRKFVPERREGAQAARRALHQGMH